MEVLFGLVVEGIKSSITPLARQIGYLLYYKSNIENLANEVNNLEIRRNDVGRSVETAQNRGHSIKNEVESWIDSVDRLRDEARRLNREAEEINSCFKGWCCARFRLGKEANKKIRIAKETLTCGERFSNSVNVSEAVPSSSIEPILTVDFHDFDSRKYTMENITEALKCEKNTVVGVYGMPGVGKTTLMKEVEKRMTDDKVFKKVLWVIVSGSPDLIKIQNEIAEQLGMGKLEEESGIARARRLHMRLKSEEKVLLILDDLWQRLEFGDVGIPRGGSCKVVLTTRKQSVCNDMETQPTIEVQGLSLQESRNLFRQKAGDVMDSVELQTLAGQVADECEGLPLAIVTLGRALRGKKLKVWEEAYRRLKDSIYFKGEEGKVVSSAIKFSFESLESDVIKSCFLFCCFFPEDYRFNENELLVYVMGEKLLPNVNTLEEARSSLHWEMDKLVSSCLLLKIDEDRDGYKMMMHDVVRDVAISIASEESYGFIVKAGLGLRQWPSNDNLVKCKRMSLMRNKINDLPDQLEHPNLLTLSLVESYSLKKFPDSCFERMTSLVILDLKNTPISSLPPSLSCLVNLSSLCLDGTSLRDVSLVGKLKKLEILSLRSTLIESLPKEIGGLANLKYLNLSNNRKLEVIPRNLLSSLSRLEELYMAESFHGWEIEEMGDGSKATLAEVASLNFLSNLHLNVDDIKCFSDKISAYPENLTKFYICVGEHSDEWLEHSDEWLEHPRTMSLTTASYPLPNWVSMFLKRTNELCLNRCEGLKNVVKLDAGGFDNLKKLTIQNCSEMEYVMSLVKEEEMMAEEVLQTISTSTRPLLFSNLTFLFISRCNKLKYLFPMKLIQGLEQLKWLYVGNCNEMKEIIIDEEEEGADVREENTTVLQTISTSTSFLLFPNLKRVDIWKCNKLKYLFPMKLVRGLEQLQCLFVSNCNEMKEIIIDEGADERKEDKTVLPQLSSLQLRHLPNITSFYPRTINFDWPSLEDLRVGFCPNLSRLPFGHHSAPNLRRIYLDNDNWFESLKWEDESIKLRLQNFFYQELNFNVDSNLLKDDAYRRKVYDLLFGIPGVYSTSCSQDATHHIQVDVPIKVTAETVIKTLKEGGICGVSVIAGAPEM